MNTVPTRLPTTIAMIAHNRFRPSTTPSAPVTNVRNCWLAANQKVPKLDTFPVRSDAGMMSTECSSMTCCSTVATTANPLAVADALLAGLNA
jgi:hypothetical protein